jgi:hypothetical protein
VVKLQKFGSRTTDLDATIVNEAVEVCRSEYNEKLADKTHDGGDRHGGKRQRDDEELGEPSYKRVVVNPISPVTLEDVPRDMEFFNGNSHATLSNTKQNEDDGQEGTNYEFRSSDEMFDSW